MSFAPRLAKRLTNRRGAARAARRLAPLVVLLPLTAARESGARAPEHGASRGTGRIEGTVALSKALTTHRPRFRMYAGDGAGALPPRRPNEDERRNVVIYLERVDDVADAPVILAGSAMPGAPTRRAVMRQVDEGFSPHVLPILRGTTVDFPNDDVVFHNVFSLSSPKTFDLGRYPRGSSKSVTFDHAGIAQVFCHIHSDMSAVVLVLENSHFARPDSAGRFALDAVPAGEYTIVGWHERIRPISRTIRVEPGRSAVVDFDIPLPPPAAAGSDSRER